MKFKVNKESSNILINIGWLFSQSAIRMALSLFVGIWVARYLGPSNYGLLNFSLALTAIFIGLAPLGLQGLVVRELNQNESEAQALMGSSFFLSLVSGLISYLLLIATIYFMRPYEPLAQLAVAIAGLSILFKAIDVIKYWFESNVNSKCVVWVQIVALIITSAVKIVLIILHAEIIAFIWVTVIESVLVAIGLLLGYRRYSESFLNWRVRKDQMAYLLKESWPLFLSSISVIANLNIDKVMLGQISGEHELGLYSVASNLAQIWYVIPVFVGASIAPSLTKLFHENPLAYAKRINMIFKYLFWLAMVLILLTTLFGEMIVGFIFGEQYLLSVKVLFIQIYNTVFLFHISFRKRLLLIEGLQKHIFYLSLYMLVSNIVLNYLLIPRLNGIGAAYASLFSWASNALIFPLLFKETRKHPKIFFLTIFSRA